LPIFLNDFDSAGIHPSRHMKSCSYCGRESEECAAHCHECGTPFVHAASRSQNDPKIAAKNRMISGALICLVGIAATIGSFLAAVNSPSGGFYVIAGGAIISGGQRFLQGYFFLWSNRQAKPSRVETKSQKACQQV
jgi:hypothetical protein